MNLNSAQDIINVAMRFCGEITDAPPSENASEYRTAAVEYLNRIYLAMLSGGNEFDVEMAEPFPWAISSQPGVFALKPAIPATVASLIRGATTGTFATAPVDAFGVQVSVAGTYLRIDTWADVYRIVTHVAGTTTFTIDFAYLQVDLVNAGGFCYFLDYEIGPDLLRLTTEMRLFQVAMRLADCEIKGSDMAAMRREFPISFLQTRYPDRFAIKSQDTTDNSMIVQINTNPPDTARVEYDFVPYPDALTDETTSIPIVPLQYRMVMAYGVAYYLCVDKNDSRAGNYLQQAQSGLISMVKAAKKQRTDTNWDRARVMPRKDLVRRTSAPWWWGWW